jgi:hypothetical protein
MIKELKFHVSNLCRIHVFLNWDNKTTRIVCVKSNNMQTKVNSNWFLELKITHSIYQRSHKNLRAQLNRSELTIFKEMKRKPTNISISEATKLLLSGSIPTGEANLAVVCEDSQWMHFHTNVCCLPPNQNNKYITWMRLN